MCNQTEDQEDLREKCHILRVCLKMREQTYKESLILEQKFTLGIVTPAVSYREIFSILIINIQHFQVQLAFQLRLWYCVLHFLAFTERQEKSFSQNNVINHSQSSHHECKSSQKATLSAVSESIYNYLQLRAKYLHILMQQNHTVLLVSFSFF